MHKIYDIFKRKQKTQGKKGDIIRYGAQYKRPLTFKEAKNKKSVRAFISTQVKLVETYNWFLSDILYDSEVFDAFLNKNCNTAITLSHAYSHFDIIYKLPHGGFRVFPVEHVTEIFALIHFHGCVPVTKDMIVSCDLHQQKNIPNYNL